MISQTINRSRQVKPESLNALSIEQTLVLLSELVTNCQSFFHTKHNDGECESMFKCYKKQNQNHENFYHDSMGERLLSAVDQVMTKAYDRQYDCYFSTYFISDSWHDAGNVYMNHWATKFDLTKFNWCQGDFWYYHPSIKSVPTENILTLIDTIRYQSSDRRTVFVSNDVISSARYCLGADNVLILKEDAWKMDGKIQSVLEEYASKDALFIWCAGIPGKVWMTELFLKYPKTSHIDMGHLFDHVFGLDSRTWHTRKYDGEYYRKYADIFIPYVNSFIRK